MEQKIKTIEQLKMELMCMLFLSSFISGVAFCYIGNITGITALKIISLICAIINIVPLGITCAFWLLRNQINKGIKYAYRHHKMVHCLRKQLIDAGIYTEVKFGVTKLAQLPNITINFTSDYQRGSIYITNSIKYHKKLGEIDISPALSGYVVEQIYLSDDENSYRYDIYDSSIVRKQYFRNLSDFRTYSNTLNDYELFIDANTKLPLTHQLLVGQTGSGKTYALHVYLLQMLMKQIKFHLYFADPKESSLALLGEEIAPDNTADNYDDMIALLEKFVEKMSKRQHEMKEHLKQKIDGDYRDFGLSPHILIFDEFADFTLITQTKEKKIRDRVNSLISSIVLRGRQSGFFLWIVMQQAGANNIPTYIRDNLPIKVVMGNAEKQTYITTYGAGVDIPQRDMDLGDGVYTCPAIANKPKLCTFPELGFDALQVLQEIEAGVM